MVYHLVYVSSATEIPTQEELVEWIEEIRSRNAFLGVTGLLLYSKGTYMQVLEGEEEVVERLYSRIQEDPRHRTPRVLLRERRPEPEFPNWSMAFRDLDSPELLATPGYSSYLNQGDANPLAFADHPEAPSRVRALLDCFRHNVPHA